MAVPWLRVCSRDIDLGGVESQASELAVAGYGGHLRGDVLHPAASLCLPKRYSPPGGFFGRAEPFRRLVTSRAIPLGRRYSCDCPDLFGHGRVRTGALAVECGLEIRCTVENAPKLLKTRSGGEAD